MATTRMGLGGPIAALAGEGGGPGPLPEPTGGGNLMLMGVASVILAVFLLIP